MNATQICEGCTLRLANDQNAICDGSGVIAITDYPASRVVVCPAWPCDEDEPLAYWQAIDGLDYDAMPPTMQQRIRDNVMRAVLAPQDVNCEPLDDKPTFVSADFLAHVDRVKTGIEVIWLTVGVVAALFVARWVMTR